MNKKQQRPPVVVFLGHVDAGKSSLLDSIRETRVAEKEAGGITQHVYAYQTEGDNKITFIDTPGHKAFSAIRQRGAQVADIAVLVVAANEGIQNQTKEAISYIKETKLPCIVAINKIDISKENINKIRGQLAKEEIIVESQGGKVPEVQTAATTGQGVDHLMELISLVAEMEELKADYKKSAEGFVLESYVDSFRGSIAKIIVREGTLKPGDIIGTSSAWGKVKGLFNYQEKCIDQALPSQPVEVLGFKKAPKAGEKFLIFKNEEEAQKFNEENEKEEITKEISEDALFNIIIKSDVHSSLEALQNILESLSDKINIIDQDVGNVTKKDIQVAHDANAEILAFRVTTDSGARGALQRYEEVEIKEFDVIYRLSKYVKDKVEALDITEEEEKVVGRLKILEVFKHGPGRQIFGGDVITGEARQGVKIKIYRGKEKIGEGKIIRLESRKQKKDVVEKGKQAGILYDGSGSIEEGDIVEVYNK